MRSSCNLDIYRYHPKGSNYVRVCRMIDEELVGLQEVSLPLKPSDFPDSYKVHNGLASLERRVGILYSFLSSLGVDVDDDAKEELGRFMRYRSQSLTLSLAQRVVLESYRRGRERKGRSEDISVRTDDLDEIERANPRFR